MYSASSQYRKTPVFKNVGLIKLTELYYCVRQLSYGSHEASINMRLPKTCLVRSSTMMTKAKAMFKLQVLVILFIGCGGTQATNTTATSFLEAPIGRVQLTREEWSKFLSDNLDPDLAPWRGRAPLSAADIIGAHTRVLQLMNIPAVIQLALIYNNRLYWPNRPDPNGGEPGRHWASYFIIHLHRRLTAALSSGRLNLPNVLFIYNTDDNAPRFNAPGRNLPVPLLSLIKSQGLEGGDDLDILVPQMYMVQTSMYFVPWHLKTDRAFFRGMPFCNSRWRARYGVVDACARLYLSHLSHQERLAGNDTMLDCGLAEPFKFRSNNTDAFLKYDLPVLGRVPFQDHAYYKWLLNMEGITASSRLGQLFLTNSLVISQRSPFLEHFYRSLRPWQHYVLFWNATTPNGTLLGMDDVYDTISELRRLDREQPWKIQEIIKAANNFAIRFLQPHTRLLYYQEVFVRYKALFRDMDSFLESYVQGLRQKGWNIP